MTKKYIIITPVRNEEKFIELTLKSLEKQIAPPEEWIVVDDGSSDGTDEIVKLYQKRIKYLRYIKKPDRGFDAVGAGVVEAFNYGLENIESKDYYYIVKLDADIYLKPDYFSMLIERFKSEKRLGIISGENYLKKKNRLVREEHADFHPVGGARMYCRNCFEAIGGLIQSPGWDTLDIIKARLAGWETKNYRDLVVVHLRDMSTRQGYAEGIKRLGRTSYLLGYNPLYFFLRCIYRAKDRPYLLRSYYLVLGYLNAMFKNEVMIVSENERKYIRRLQLKRLGLLL